MDTVQKYQKDIDFAIKAFWNTREQQISAQKIHDAGTRGAVTGGKQLDGLLLLLQKIALDLGVPEEYIHIKGNQLPGYFRATKDWDFIITSPKGHLLVCVELKSQVGSFGNNFNNRTEEALGSAVDLWTAYREGVFPPQQQPWLGYVLIVEKSTKSMSPIRVQEPYFSVLKEFQDTSYLMRYEILCRKLVLERHYSAAAMISTAKVEEVSYDTPDNEASFYAFLDAYVGYMVGKHAEFN